MIFKLPARNSSAKQSGKNEFWFWRTRRGEMTAMVPTFCRTNADVDILSNRYLSFHSA